MADRRKHSEDIPEDRRDMVWPYLWESQQHNLLLRQITELEYERSSIPVWCVTGGTTGSMPVFPGPFVRYEDFPAELLMEFLQGKEVPIGPFYCTAYAEDVRLFLELRHQRE